MKNTFWILLSLLLSACGSLPGHGPMLDGDGGAPAPEPLGRQTYCAQAAQRDDARDRRFRESFCGAAVAPAAIVELTPERFREMEEVHRRVNAAVSYRSTTTWDPLAAEGDCKTYAARKELELLERGWPAGAMRLATAFVNNGGVHQYQYHAVLLVDTDRGTIVLDNRHREPRRWDEVSYVWMTAQVPGHRAWARLPADNRQVALALAANAPRPGTQVSALQ